MHPLEQSIDESFHLPKTVVKRRTSLDNSCLLSSNNDDSFMVFLPDDEKEEFEKKERRLSLDNNMEATNTTFLADIESSKQPKVDLDADWHSSLHSSNNNISSNIQRGSYKGGRKQSTHSKASQNTETINTSSYSSEEEVAGGGSSSSSSDEDSFDDDSDCDSFCDASVGEPANRTYLRRDLGASVMWSDCDSMDGLSLQGSWAGSDCGDQLHFDSPPGKPQRSFSGSTAGLPRTPLRMGGSSSSASPIPSFLRPPLRNHSSGSVASLLSSPRQLRRGRRRSIDENHELEMND